jgi:hypothetical protein
MILKKLTLEEVIKEVLGKDRPYIPIEEESSLFKAIQEC